MWLKKHYKTIIRLSYIIPILFAAGVSIAHVVTWYGLTNPFSWAVYLSVGIEIAALSALAGITVKMNKWVYFPFIIVTIIQFIGNVFFSFQFIDVTNKVFLSWVDLVNPLFDSIGMANANDLQSHRRWLALFAGGLIPIISLSFLHLLIKFNDKEGDTMEIKPDNISPEPEAVVGESKSNLTPEPEVVVDKMEEDKKNVNWGLNKDGIKRRFLISVGNIPEDKIDEYVRDVKERLTAESPIITSDLFIPPFANFDRDIFIPEPSIEAEPEIEDVEIEVEDEVEPEIEEVDFEPAPTIDFETDYFLGNKGGSVEIETLPAETQNEAILDTNIPESSQSTIDQINIPKIDSKDKNRMAIERIGMNKINKNHNPNNLFYRGDE